MAKVGKERFVFSGAEKGELRLDVEIQISAKGQFYCNLPEDFTILLEKYQLIKRHDKTKHRLESDTYKGILLKIKELGEECVSRELIKEKTIIQYAISTACSFGFTVNNDIVPNMGWSEDGPLKDTWKNGTISTHAANQRPTLVTLYVKVAAKRTYRYKDGKEVTEIEVMSPFDRFKGGDYYMRWLAGIASTCPHNEAKLKEMDYTPERGKFFVDMYKGLCRIAYQVAQFTEPDKMIELIESNQKLIG